MDFGQLFQNSCLWSTKAFPQTSRPKWSDDERGDEGVIFTNFFFIITCFSPSTCFIQHDILAMYFERFLVVLFHNALTFYSQVDITCYACF